MTKEEIGEILKQAEKLVTDNIKDESLKVKAFELAYNELLGKIMPPVTKESHTLTSGQHQQVKKSESIVEHCKRFKINNEIDRTLIFASFLEKQEGQNYFITKNIQDCYFKAKEKQPPNIPDKISKNISKGFIMESNEKPKSGKGYVLTRTGEEEVKKLELKNE